MADEEQASVDSRDIEAFLRTARKRFEFDSLEEKHIRDEAREDLRFEAGEQWDPKVKSDRIKQGRPALVFNRTHTFVQQVANEARQNKPQIKFVPEQDDGKDTAEVKEGLARHIQYESDAQIAYETAIEYAAGGSFGYVRLLTDYCDNESFDQDLKVVPIFDPFTVYGVLMPATRGQEPDHAFVVEEITKEEFEREYPKSEVVSLGWEQAMKGAPDWITPEKIKIAEYWYVDYETKTLKKGKKQRPVTVPHVKFCKINGFEILDGSETDWIGTSIPIVPVLGKQIVVDGNTFLLSVIRFQRAPQQLLNVYKTRIAETLGSSPVQPWLIDPRQVKGYESQWSMQNLALLPYLPYNRMVDGQDLGEPKRMVFEAPIQALSAASQQEVDDMKATAGIYDPSLGAKSNSTSGIAKLRDQQQSTITNLHFMDNLERAFKKLGTMIAELIPLIYDTARTVKILGQDETPKIVRINEAQQDGKHYKIGGDGSQKDHVIVTVGRAFSTKRMESFDMMTQVLQTSPNLLPMIGDIFFKNSDLAGADQLADRFKKMLPPQLQDQPDGQEQQIPPQVQAQLQQMQQAHQQLNAYAQQLEQENQQYKAGAQVKQAQIESNERIKMAELQLDRVTKVELPLALAEINTRAQNLRERSNLEADLNGKLQIQANDHAHEAAMAAANVGHEAAMTNADQQHEDQTAEVAHERAKETADIGHAHAMEMQASKPQPKAKAE